MKIIAGRFKGRQLRCPDSKAVRPTNSIVKGAIFNILHDRLAGAEVLDLYAGTGALGLEALSRGARRVTLVERESAAIKTIRDNISSLKAGEGAAVVEVDALAYLRGCTSEFDIILADPPYGFDASENLFTTIEARKLLKPTGILVYQHSPATAMPEASGRLRLVNSRWHGRTQLSLYHFDEEEEHG